MIVGKVSDRTQAIVDRPDGSFELALNPSGPGLLLRAIKWILSILFFGAPVILVVASLSMSWADRVFIAAFAVVMFIGGLLAQWAFRPPVLRVDAGEVAIPSGMYRQRMPRSDLALIFRGRAWGGGYHAGSWTPTYLFVAKDGKPGLTIAASLYTSDGIALLAQRLQVSIRGDFSVQVKDRVDPTS